MTKKRLTKVVKRNGRIVAFDQERIVNAIFKAALSIGGEDRALAQKVAEVVVETLNKNFSDDDPPTVEDVQDTVVE
ncbi:MAG: ATP cone domain-containing protein, partial [Candidatus Sumerlaeia bacterium]|nr:ATP cone domain-containing protein [Candidatus Sumerlaeia bacterium]